MPVIAKPDVPKVGKITHHVIELVWEDVMETAGNTNVSGDDRMKVILQQEEAGGKWTNIYYGFDRRHTIDNADPQRTYAFRLKLQYEDAESEWSPVLTVTTQKEPLTGIHLHRAVQMNDIMGTERILEGGEVNVEVTDKYGFTPLMQAACKGYTDIIELLVRHSADVNIQNDAGKTALMLAAFSGKLESIQTLRENGAKEDMRDKGGSTALHWAVDGQSIEVLEWCLDDGWDVNVKDTGSSWTPLHRCAAINGNKDVAKVLVKNGANIDAMDSDGKTALMIAVINGHQGLVEALLSFNADISIKNAYGKNVFEMAQSMEKRRIIKVLEEHMAKNSISLKKSKIEN